jgi:CHAT domain-containing protein
MDAFYQQWLSGKSKQEAFKEAQQQVRGENPQPYYWAAFVMLD